jgi:hypothetical protein
MSFASPAHNPPRIQAIWGTMAKNSFEPRSIVRDDPVIFIGPVDSFERIKLKKELEVRIKY